jgi:PIN domain nuclease of toxin-antitoxin system
VLLWWLEGERLRDAAQAAIADPDNAVSVSAASMWEISVKHGLGRVGLPPDFVEQVAETSFAPLAITAAHGWRAGQLPRHHSDPFDRMLVAQAQEEGLTIVTRDPDLARYTVALLAA